MHVKASRPRAHMGVGAFDDASNDAEVVPGLLGATDGQLEPAPCASDMGVLGPHLLKCFGDAAPYTTIAENEIGRFGDAVRSISLDISSALLEQE